VIQFRPVEKRITRALDEIPASAAVNETYRHRKKKIAFRKASPKS